jgi:hypothetical protein
MPLTLPMKFRNAARYRYKFKDISKNENQLLDAVRKIQDR